MRLISENALNDSIDKWFSPGPWAHCAYFSWPGLGCQLLIVTKAIDCDLWDPTFRDSCKLQSQCCCAALPTRPPLNIYLNTGCWYSSSVHPLDDTVHAPARRPALTIQLSHHACHLTQWSTPGRVIFLKLVEYLVLLSLTRLLWDKRYRRLSEEFAR